MEVLTLLLSIPGEVVTSEELLQSVWKHQSFAHLETNVLGTAITKLRNALGKDARRIVNLPRVGYRFEGRVERTIVRTIPGSGPGRRHSAVKELYSFKEQIAHSLPAEKQATNELEDRTLFRYRFGDTEFDEARFELQVGGQVIEVQPRPLAMLALLLRTPGEVVTSEEILDSVWRYHDPSALETNIIGTALTKLRNALGKDARRIVNLPRVRYRFEGRIERIAVGRTLNVGPGYMGGPADELFSFEDQLRLELPPEKRIITALETGMGQLLHEIAKHPEQVRVIGSRKFEELVAYILDKHGFSVELTQATRDGGRDIIAIRTDTLGIRSKFLVECKKYSAEHPVRVELVRSLYGVQVQEGANKAILATTSYFTPDAKKFASTANTTEWAMDLKDYDAVINWVRSTSHI